jgi:hypothetical protein
MVQRHCVCKGSRGPCRQNPNAYKDKMDSYIFPVPSTEIRNMWHFHYAPSLNGEQLYHIQSAFSKAQFCSSLERSTEALLYINPFV